jgi:hypothetical protein
VSSMNADPDHIIHVAIELSPSTWLLAMRLPRAEKPRPSRIAGGDTTALLALLSSLRIWAKYSDERVTYRTMTYSGSSRVGAEKRCTFGDDHRKTPRPVAKPAP